MKNLNIQIQEIFQNYDCELDLLQADYLINEINEEPEDKEDIIIDFVGAVVLDNVDNFPGFKAYAENQEEDDENAEIIGFRNEAIIEEISELF